MRALMRAVTWCGTGSPAGAARTLRKRKRFNANLSSCARTAGKTRPKGSRATVGRVAPGQGRRTRCRPIAQASPAYFPGGWPAATPAALTRGLSHANCDSSSRPVLGTQRSAPPVAGWPNTQRTAQDSAAQRSAMQCSAGAF